MKILYVGDGRSRNNWGAQSTSAALFELLNKKNTVFTSIKSEMKITKYPVFGAMGIFKKLQKAAIRRKHRPGFNIAYKFLKFVGLTEDYLTDDINLSVKSFLKAKDQHEDLKTAYESIVECDAVVLNGEGSFIFTTPPRRDALFFLMVLKLAQEMGKKTYCLNAMISDCPRKGRNHITVAQTIEMFKQCNAITLRDAYSYKFLKELSPEIKNIQYVPDALFTWVKKIDNKSYLPVAGKKTIKVFDNGKFAEKEGNFEEPYICISGSSLAARFKNEAIPSYTAMINKLKETNRNLFIVPTDYGDSFMYEVSERTGVPVIPEYTNVVEGAAILANAEVFVSGRFHPSILASLKGTPCVFLGSNSHKTLTLQHMLEYDYVVEYDSMPTQADIEEIYKDVSAILENVPERRIKIRETVDRLSNHATTVIENIVN